VNQIKSCRSYCRLRAVVTDETPRCHSGSKFGRRPFVLVPVSGDEAMSSPTACRAVGIDLGTTFSVIAHLDPAGRPTTIPNAEGDLTTPSVVLFDAESIVVGKEALKAAVMEPERVALFAKRDMGCAVYSHTINGERLPPEVIQSLILEKIKKDGEAKLGPIRQVVITVPAYFNEPRRKATQDAGRLAGLEVLDIINEPTAAALTYGVQHGFLTASGESRQAETILVFDLGGGTFDVTLMRIDGREYRTLATAGDVYLGGIDWDRRIVGHVAEAFQSAHHSLDPKDHPAGFQRLLREAEDAKRTLSARDQVTINFEHAGHAVRLALTRQQFEAMTADLLDRTRFTTTNLLREAGMKVTDLTRLLLVGGSTRMPMVGAMLERELGIKPDRSLSVDEAVAHGAAIYAGLILSSEPSLQGMSVRNVNSHSLGVLGIESATGRKRNKILIPRNTPLPVRKAGRFQTRHEDQRSVSVQVIEGGDPSGNGSTPIGRCIVRDLPSGLPAATPVMVNFEYAENGRLTVEARIPTIDKQALLTLDRETGLSEEKLATWQDRLKRGSRPLGLES
jgi:molecular chaperone DnaK